MDMPKSPWRYPHLMFRTDSRKSKAVSFKQNPAFDPTGMLRRTDSKESNCSSMTSMSQREDLRQTLSVPVSAFHVSIEISNNRNMATALFRENFVKLICILHSREFIFGEKLQTLD